MILESDVFSMGIMLKIHMQGKNLRSRDNKIDLNMKFLNIYNLDIISRERKALITNKPRFYKISQKDFYSDNLWLFFFDI